MMAKRPTTESRLKDAREASAEATAAIRSLEGKRAEALLADDDLGAGKLLAEIEKLRVFVRGTEDKIGLLEGEAKKETAERHARENASLIGRIETKFAAREAVAEQIVTGIGQLNRLALELIEQSRAVDAAWGWTNADRFGLLLLRDGLVAAIQHEFYRQTAIPRLGGGQHEGRNAGWQLPGSRPPRLDLVHRPKEIPSLVDVLRDASVYASDVMRARRTPATTAPVVPATAPEPRERTKAETELAGLLQRQNQLAAIANPTPEDDRAYGELVKQISIAQTAIEEQANAR
jgi:hypothetical protein